MFRALDLAAFALAASLVPTAASAQQSTHTMHHQMMHRPPKGQTVPTQPGQEAFAAIQEIVAMLEADPRTDWSKVDIDALRSSVLTPEADRAKLHGLGFFGILTVGMHHQQHHLMIARGESPHG